VPRS